MIRVLMTGISLGVLLSMAILWLVLYPKEVEAPMSSAQESCWSGTLAVQMPGYTDSWWVNYGARNDNQVQICGVGLRVGDIQSFPDYSATIQRLEKELQECRKERH